MPVSRKYLEHVMHDLMQAAPAATVGTAESTVAVSRDCSFQRLSQGRLSTSVYTYVGFPSIEDTTKNSRPNYSPKPKDSETVG